MVNVGIDIGAKGALCILDTSNSNTSICFVDYSKVGLNGYINALKNLQTDNIIVELVHSMPKQGVASMFSFGQRFGEVIGILTALNKNYILVTPQKWQKELNLMPKATKKQIASTILDIYPQANLLGNRGGLLDGRSDALALAHYGFLKGNKCYSKN